MNAVKGDIAMQKHESHSNYQDFFEYHGNTIIEFIRRQEGITILRDWLLFDSAEEALAFLNTTCEA